MVVQIVFGIVLLLIGMSGLVFARDIFDPEDPGVWIVIGTAAALMLLGSWLIKLQFPA